MKFIQMLYETDLQELTKKIWSFKEEHPVNILKKKYESVWFMNSDTQMSFDF